MKIEKEIKIIVNFNEDECFIIEKMARAKDQTITNFLEVIFIKFFNEKIGIFNKEDDCEKKEV